MQRIQISAIKYQLIHQFYGIEEYLDMSIPLPCLIDSLEGAETEFNLWLKLKELDLWFIRVSGKEQPETWDPFKEPLYQFTARHPLIVAHLYAEKQIDDKEIISYTKQYQFAC